MCLGETETGECSCRSGGVARKTGLTFANTNHRPLETATSEISGQVFGLAPVMGAPGRCAAMAVAGHQRAAFRCAPFYLARSRREKSNACNA